MATRREAKMLATDEDDPRKDLLGCGIKVQIGASDRSPAHIFNPPPFHVFIYNTIVVYYLFAFSYRYLGPGR